jgi:hypothetical protein
VALLRYTTLRLALFLIVAAVLFLVGVRNLFACALIAVLISGLVSVVVLRKTRGEIGGKARTAPSPPQASAAPPSKSPRKSPLRRINDRIDQAASSEDEADDARRANGVQVEPRREQGSD